ncbi:hypothetical protein [Agrobacterium rosae]|uniref:hypothetical protein n=1 Tax=Agrobacterium rosae TaxID=1972867 RepID=UPI003B9F83AA
MSDAIRLYIITDNPEEAARGLLGCRVASLPGWIKVLNNPFEIEKLPSGSSAMGLFFPNDTGGNIFIETVWRERRERGGIDYDFGKHLEKLTEWMRRRDEAEAVILAEVLAQEKQLKQGEAA